MLSVLIRQEGKRRPFHSNFVLNITKGENGNIYEIEGTEETFEDIHKMLGYYEMNPLTPKVTHIGQPCVNEWWLQMNKRGTTI